MGKEDVIGFPVNPFPGNLLSFFSPLSDLFLFWFFCDGFLMAPHADINVGHSGKLLGFKITVTGVTLQPLCEMFLMVEGDRLFSLGADAQTDEKEEQKEPYYQSNKEEFHTENRRVSIGLFRGSPGSNTLDRTQLLYLE